MLTRVVWLVRGRGSERDPWRELVRHVLVAAVRLGGLRPRVANLDMRSDLVRVIRRAPGPGADRSSPGERDALEMEASSVLSDLVALTPPFLVAAAFLIAVGAFVRHEMRAAKKQSAEQGDEVDEPSSGEQIGDRGSGLAR